MSMFTKTLRQSKCEMTDTKEWTRCIHCKYWMRLEQNDKEDVLHFIPLMVGQRLHCINGLLPHPAHEPLKKAI